MATYNNIPQLLGATDGLLLLATVVAANGSDVNARERVQLMLREISHSAHFFVNEGIQGRGIERVLGRCEFVQSLLRLT